MGRRAAKSDRNAGLRPPTIPPANAHHVAAVIDAAAGLMDHADRANRSLAMATGALSPTLPGDIEISTDVKLTEIERMVDVDMKAFFLEPLANAIFPTMQTNPASFTANERCTRTFLTDEVRCHLGETVEGKTPHQSVVYIAVDPFIPEEKHRIVGFAVWNTGRHTRDVGRDEKAKEVEDVDSHITSGSPLEKVIDWTFCDIYNAAAKRAYREIVKEPRDAWWELERLVVHPEYQGRGIGKALLTPMFEKAKAQGKSIYIEASAAGVFLYKKMGCEAVKHLVWKTPGGTNEEVTMTVCTKLNPAVSLWKSLIGK